MLHSIGEREIGDMPCLQGSYRNDEKNDNTYLKVWFYNTDHKCQKRWWKTFEKETVVVQSLSHVCLCNLMDWSTPGFPVLHYLLELAQTHVYWISDAIQLSHPLPPPFPSALNLSQYQGLFQWVSSSHQVVKVLELQLQHQSFQWIFWVDFL